MLSQYNIIELKKALESFQTLYGSYSEFLNKLTNIFSTRLEIMIIDSLMKHTNIYISSLSKTLLLKENRLEIICSNMLQTLLYSINNNTI